VLCITYADDITVIVRDSKDIQTLQRLIKVYEQAVGAKINWKKCSGLPVGNWDQTHNIQGIPYIPTTKILGIYYSTKIGHTIDYTWEDKFHTIIRTVKELQIRQLDIQQRIWVSNSYYLAKIWYTAQIIPIPEKQAQRITSIIHQFIWRGNIFRVPASTLHKPRQKGGLGMVNISAKCRTLFLMRLLKQCKQQDSITAHWIDRHEKYIQHDNPPQWITLPQASEYLRTYVQEKAYISNQTDTETEVQYKQKIYDVLHSTQFNISTILPMRMQLKYPQHNWTNIWNNINKKFMPHN
jgi:hypothetical protein